MNKYLPDDIDNFFLDNLNSYAEEPANNVWENIDLKLSEKKEIKSTITYLKVAVIIILATSPFLLADSLWRSVSRVSDDKHNVVTNIKSKGFTSEEVALPNVKDYSSYSKFIKPNQAIIRFNKNDFLLAKIDLSTFLTSTSEKNKLPLLNSLNLDNLSKNNLDIKTNTGADEAKKVTVTLSKNHKLTINPFYSFDHISGRFIEQYEFDNQDKNYYTNREKPDISFTGGVLAEYALNKKLSLVSGISFSSSNISITSTAVNALKDESGIYKFKLATSYGLAEISKSGIDPGAGDTLQVSDASMQFNYVSIPLFMKYNIAGKKIKLSVRAGAAINKIVGEKIDVDYLVQNNNEKENIKKIEGIRKIFFTINTGFDAAYSLNKTMDISISPELRYGINSINKGTPVKTFPVNYGLALGLHLKL